MPLSFPTSPSTGDTFQSDTVVYRFDGEKWQIIVRIDFGDLRALGNEIPTLANATANIKVFDAQLMPRELQANIDFTVIS